MERILDAVSEMAAALPDGPGDREVKVIGIYATLIGTLQLARAVHGTPLSERVLAAGADAARELVRGAPGKPA
jgi:hypothetical protein